MPSIKPSLGFSLFFSLLLTVLVLLPCASASGQDLTFLGSYSQAIDLPPVTDEEVSRFVQVLEKAGQHRTAAIEGMKASSAPLLGVLNDFQTALEAEKKACAELGIPNEEFLKTRSRFLQAMSLENLGKAQALQTTIATCSLEGMMKAEIDKKIQKQEQTVTDARQAVEKAMTQSSTAAAKGTSKTGKTRAKLATVEAKLAKEANPKKKAGLEKEQARLQAELAKPASGGDDRVERAREKLAKAEEKLKALREFAVQNEAKDAAGAPDRQARLQKAEADYQKLLASPIMQQAAKDLPAFKKQWEKLHLFGGMKMRK